MPERVPSQVPGSQILWAPKRERVRFRSPRPGTKRGRWRCSRRASKAKDSEEFLRRTHGAKFHVGGGGGEKPRGCGGGVSVQWLDTHLRMVARAWGSGDSFAEVQEEPRLYWTWVHCQTLRETPSAKHERRQGSSRHQNVPRLERKQLQLMIRLQPIKGEATKAWMQFPCTLDPQTRACFHVRAFPDAPASPSWHFWHKAQGVCYSAQTPCQLTVAHAPRGSWQGLCELKSMVGTTTSRYSTGVNRVRDRARKEA